MSYPNSSKNDNMRTWACKLCTFENPEDSIRCGACETLKDETRDMWSCEACTFDNRPSLNRCEVCSTWKPGITPEERQMGRGNRFMELFNLLGNIRPFTPPSPVNTEADERQQLQFPDLTRMLFGTELFGAFMENAVGEEAAMQVLFPNGYCDCPRCNIVAQLKIRIFTQNARSEDQRLLARIMNDRILPRLTRMGTLSVQLLNMGGMGGLEEFINQTLNSEEHHPIPATDDAVNNLKRLTLTEDHLEILQENCAICLTQFKAEDEVVEPKCKHHFHPICFLPWMKENHTCPTCRTSVEDP